MKVCIIGTRGFPNIQGGVEKHCEILYPLIGEQNDINILVYRRAPYVKVTPDYQNIQFIDLPSTKIKGIEAFFHSFIATIAAICKRPDAIHYHNIGPAMFSPIARLFGIKVITTYHSANYEHKKWGFFAKFILRTSEKITFIFSNKIIFVNKFQLQKSPVKYFNKYIYIPNGIPQVTNYPSTDYINSLRLTKGKYILAVGRITPEKGFDTLIKAFNKVNTEYKLVIAGGVETENSYLKELKDLTKGNSTIFTGFILSDKLSELYSNAGLFVLSSKNEGFPIVLLEAMAHGLDVLVSDIPATHLVELNKDDYFSLTDEKSLIDGIENKIRKNIHRKYNLSDFSWTTIAQNTYDVYKSL